MNDVQREKRMMVLVNRLGLWGVTTSVENNHVMARWTEGNDRHGLAVVLDVFDEHDDDAVTHLLNTELKALRGEIDDAQET